MTWERKRTSRTQQGYGADHQAARKAFAAVHSPSHPCVRCGEPLGPMGPGLHLDHNSSRTGYLGFAHGPCNRKAGALEGNRRSQGERPKLITSREW